MSVYKPGFGAFNSLTSSMPIDDSPKFTTVVSAQESIRVSEELRAGINYIDTDKICQKLSIKISEQLLERGFMKHSVSYSVDELIMVHKLELNAAKQHDGTIMHGFGDETVFALYKETFSMAELEHAIKTQYPERFI